ncbi:MAG TPA: ATP-binding cassette domain-containing protein, partial [Verrucomicrobiae bacterium]|nr:ATP-binding cassette domain-containing protein [Verrucomicrobiae bacterium]
MSTIIDRNAAVACSRVTKHFGEGENRVEVLRGVDLTIPFGEMTLLVGPSGCGKTTMLSVIAGLLDRSGGELNVLGRDLAELSGSQAVLFRRKNLGFVF